MDPNANLREQEELIQELSEYRGLNESHPAARNARHDLRELREALTGWLRGGGFAPDWSACPNASTYFRLLRLAPGWKLADCVKAKG